jgi:hypothetical protein
MRLDLSVGESCSDTELLELRHQLLEQMGKTPECLSDVRKLRDEVYDLVAERIYGTDDKRAIAHECVNHWKKTLVPDYTEFVVESVRLKLRDLLSIDTLVDLRFALERGIRHQTPWEDLLLAKVGPAVTQSAIAPEQMRRAVALIRSEYEVALQIATL